MYCYALDPVRLACLIHAASVRSEPESNSPITKHKTPSLFREKGLLAVTLAQALSPITPLPMRSDAPSRPSRGRRYGFNLLLLSKNICGAKHPLPFSSARLSLKGADGLAPPQPLKLRKTTLVTLSDCPRASTGKMSIPKDFRFGPCAPILATPSCFYLKKRCTASRSAPVASRGCRNTRAQSMPICLRCFSPPIPG
jgi:hypothetical protein